jgi:hypothetical protein
MFLLELVLFVAGFLEMKQAGQIREERQEEEMEGWRRE